MRCNACILSGGQPLGLPILFSAPKAAWPEPIGAGQNAEQVISVSGTAEAARVTGSPTRTGVLSPSTDWDGGLGHLERRNSIRFHVGVLVFKNLDEG